MIQEDLSSIAHRPGLVWGFDLSGEAPRPIHETELGSPESVPQGLKWLHFNLSDQRTLRWLAGALPERMVAFLAAAQDDQGFVLEDGVLGIALNDIEHDFLGGERRRAIDQGPVELVGRPVADRVLRQFDAQLRSGLRRSSGSHAGTRRRGVRRRCSTARSALRARGCRRR